MNKRILALLFAAVMLIGLLAACQTEEEVSTPEDNSTAATTTTASNQEADPTTGGNETEPTDPGVTEPGTTETTTPDTPGTTVPNGPTKRTTRSTAIITTVVTTVPTKPAGATLAKDKVVDLDGYVMTYGTAWRYQEVVSASTLDDILWHDAMKRVMEEYNCQIQVKSNVYANAETLKTYVMANRSPADIMCMLYGQMYLPALGAGYLQAWDEIEGNPINLADARWDVNQLCVSPFDGKLYGMSFPMCPGVPQLRHVVFANKTLLGASGVNINEIYDAIDSKQWDWDLMRSYAVKATRDTDSNGVNDTWGITGKWDYMFYDFVWSNGGRLITIKDGVVTATMDSAANVEAVAYLEQIIKTDKIVYFPDAFYSEETWSASGSYDAVQEFKKGKIAFLFHEAWNCDQQMMGKNPVNFDFALLPIPMGPKAKDYVSPHDLGSCDAMLRTISEERKTKAAIIYNAWARPVDDNLDYSEEQQENMFQSNDTRSMAMYQMLATKTFLDYGTAVPELTSQFTHAMASSVLWGLQSPVAAVEGLSGTFNAEISAIFSGATKK